MWTCAGLGLLGAVFLTAAQNVGMFIAFRFFAGAGAWSFLSVSKSAAAVPDRKMGPFFIDLDTAPTYTAELAPPALRGLFVGMCGVFVGTGYALGTYMGLAFHSATNDAQWRGQYGVTIFINLIVVIIIFFTPESPRWLLLVNRPEEARKVVQRLYNLHENDENSAPIIEYQHMVQQTEFDRTLNSSWLQMLRKPSYRKRVILTCGYAFVGQSTGCMGMYCFPLQMTVINLNSH